MISRCEVHPPRRRRALPWAALVCWLGIAAVAAAEDSPPDRPSLTRRQLIGAWRLVRIDFAGPNGPLTDPFYQAGSQGLIVYDASGWMSCQIGAPQRAVPAHRRSGGRATAAAQSAVPESRLHPPATLPEARTEAAAYDSYYAYYGTWEFDAATSVVTHHVRASLLPGETGLDYAQAVTLEGGRLIFRVRQGTPGRETLRTKVWERLPDPDGGG